MHKQNLELNNLQWLVCNKTQSKKPTKVNKKGKELKRS